MIEIRRFDDLGRFDLDWLAARHHFSFGHYHDPSRMGVGPLIVWNDDTIQPGTGFDMHGHRDMEIVTYVRRGAITHQDHLGNRGRTEAGNVQVMSAGKGILHAEYNLEDDITQIFQIWIRPTQTGLAPRWEQRAFPRGERGGRLISLASGQDAYAGEALAIHQDATLFGATLKAGQSVSHGFAGGRLGYLVAARGRLGVNGTEVAARDGVAVSAEREILIEALDDSEFLLADLPAS
jgi:redox-sensitive bicupin YhaK (pirin superfamily)